MAMRKIDPRVKVTRRNFLQSSAAAAPAATLLAGAAFGPESAWADATTLSPHVMATLTQAARDIYPHDQIGDAAYRKAVSHWDTDAAATPATATMINDGVASLDREAKARFGTDYLTVPSEMDRVAILQAVESGAFFKAVRADLVVSLYNQKELWPKFGYEGPSAQHGGYLHHGFNDIDWLSSV
jgi:hypothetical protein